LRTRVKVLRQLGRLADAEAAGRDAVARRPDEGDLWIELGRVYDDQHRYSEALDAFTRARSVDPGGAGALCAWSAAMRSLRRFGEAERAVLDAIRNYPHELDLQAELAWIYYDRRDLDRARRSFSRLHDAEDNPRDRAEGSHGLGWVEFAAGDYDSAERRFREGWQLDPPPPRYRLGIAWTIVRRDDMERLDDANTLCHEVLDLEPDNDFAYACLGVAAYRRRNYPLAEQHLRRAIDLHPTAEAGSISAPSTPNSADIRMPPPN